MITGGQGFTGRYITQRLAAGGRVISYDRDFATVEGGALIIDRDVRRARGTSMTCVMRKSFPKSLAF